MDSSSQPGSSVDPELRKWQIENLRAQSQYYERHPSLLERLSPWASGLAALVAFITLVVNYRYNVQARRDTNFYEALKRFGDKDSPSVRVSATLLLSEMAQRLPTIGLTTKKVGSQYLPTVLRQFVAGMLLEKNPVALESLQSVFFELAHHDESLSAALLSDQNKSLAANLVDAFAELLAANGVSTLNAISAESWAFISMETGLPREAFEGLILNFNGRYSTAANSKFDELLQRTAMRLASATGEKGLGMQRKRSSAKLRRASTLMRANIQVYSRASGDMLKSEIWAPNLFLPGANLTFHAKDTLYLQELNGQNAKISGLVGAAKLYDSDLRGAFINANLQGAYLKRTDLRGADFNYANLQKAVLQDTDLRGAKVYQVDLQDAFIAGAKIDDKTLLSETNWWRADFSKDGVTDAGLIGQIFERWFDKYYLKDNPSKAGTMLAESHPTVRPHFEKLLNEHLAHLPP